MLQSSELEKSVVLAVKEFAASIKPKRKVFADMSVLTEVTAQLPLANLDYWERLIRTEFSSAISANEPPKWTFWSKSLPSLTWLDLISWDGYKREKMLRAVTGGAPNRFFFALTVRRLNDWVPQVRKAARETLPHIAKNSDPKNVAEALGYSLSHWNSWGRIEEQDKQALLSIITDEAIALALKNKIMTSVSGPMASLLAQVGRTSPLDKFLLDIAENSVQPSVRAKAYRCLMEGRMAWVEGREWQWTDKSYCEGRLRPIVRDRIIQVEFSLIDLLRKSANDSSSIVRRVAAEFVIRELSTLGPEAYNLANRFAADRASPVSERGKFALRKLEELRQ